MPSKVTSYRQDGKSYLEVCPLEVCKHDVGKKIHYVFEFPKGEGEAFIQEAFRAVEEKEE